jgi:hypothetical protein
LYNITKWYINLSRLYVVIKCLIITKSKQNTKRKELLKSYLKGQVWLTLISLTLDTGEAEISRIEVQGQPRQKVSEI